MIPLEVNSLFERLLGSKRGAGSKYQRIVLRGELPH